MTVYYHDATVAVTSAEYCVDGRRYALVELSYVWHRRGRSDPQTMFRRAARWLLLLVAAAMAAAYAAKTPVTMWLGSGIPELPLRLMFGLGVSIAVLAIGWPLAELVLRGLDHVHVHGVVVREIWARWHGYDVLLLRSSDALRFGRVYRALQRALEQQEELLADEGFNGHGYATLPERDASRRTAFHKRAS